MRRAVPLLAVLAVVACPLARADDVLLRNGTVVSGVIESRDAAVLRVRTPQGLVLVTTRDVVKVTDDVTDTEEEKPTRATARPRREVSGPEEGPRPVSLQIEDGAEVRVPPVERAPAPAVPLAKDDPRAPVLRALVQRLGDTDRAVRAAAAEQILADWSASSPSIDLALVHGNVQARFEAVHMLRDPRAGNRLPHLRRALTDPSDRIVMAALRTIRRLTVVALEEDVLRVLTGTAPWGVRHDAARVLERIGGPRSFAVVVSLWSSEPDERRRRRLKRVMSAIAGEDLGDDARAWHDAVTDAFLDRRTLRDPHAVPDDRPVHAPSPD